MYIVNLRFLADVVLFAGILAVTAVLTVLFTKIRIAWWLRRWKFALARTLIVLGSLGASVFAVIYNLAHYPPDSRPVACATIRPPVVAGGRRW